MAGLVDRRVFLQASLAAGLAVVVRPLAAFAQSASLQALATASDPTWQGSTTTAARRIDGRAKVVGAKLYAADFRAQDMPGWPIPRLGTTRRRLLPSRHAWPGVRLAD